MTRWTIHRQRPLCRVLYVGHSAKSSVTWHTRQKKSRSDWDFALDKTLRTLKERVSGGECKTIRNSDHIDELYRCGQLTILLPAKEFVLWSRRLSHVLHLTAVVSLSCTTCVYSRVSSSSCTVQSLVPVLRGFFCLVQIVGLIWFQLGSFTYFSAVKLCMIPLVGSLGPCIHAAAS